MTFIIPHTIDPSDFMVMSWGIGRKLFHVSETDSTNRLAKLWIADALGRTGSRAVTGSELDGTVFLADSQTAGRGRLNRTWNSSPGQNLLLTAVVHLPEFAESEPLARGLLPLATALAVSHTLSKFVSADSISIKWPNDILIQGRKCSGILMEAGANDLYLIGIGINVNESNFPESLSDTATSVLLHTGQRVDRKAVYNHLIAAFTANLTLLRETPSSILSAYKKQVSGIGTTVRISAGSTTASSDGCNAERNAGSIVVEGIMKGIHSDGGLIVESNSVQKVYYAGDVTLSPSSVI